MPAPMTTWPSPSTWRKCWPASAPCCAGVPATRRANSPAGPCSLDTKSARVTVNGMAIKLTSLEFRLLSYLMHHKGKVVSRTELVEHLYDQDFDRDSNTIEVFVGRLRKKLGVDVLHTIRGMGYCVTEPDNAA